MHNGSLGSCLISKNLLFSYPFSFLFSFFFFLFPGTEDGLIYGVVSGCGSWAFGSSWCCSMLSSFHLPESLFFVFCLCIFILLGIICSFTTSAFLHFRKSWVDYCYVAFSLDCPDSFLKPWCLLLYVVGWWFPPCAYLDELLSRKKKNLFIISMLSALPNYDSFVLFAHFSTVVGYSVQSITFSCYSIRKSWLWLTDQLRAEWVTGCNCGGDGTWIILFYFFTADLIFLAVFLFFF